MADLGEPARSQFTPDQGRGLLAAAGWQPWEAPGRQLNAGLLLASVGAAGTAAACGPQARPRHLHPRRPGPDGAALPLSALLSAALVAFTIEADNEAEHRLPHRTTDDGLSPGATAGSPWLTSLLMWANCLRQLPDDGITVAELGHRARTGTNLDGMRRWRYVTYQPDPGRGKRPGPDATVTLTAAGRRAREVWHTATEETEARWRTRLGAAAIDRLRAALADVVARLDPALPDCLPILGYGLRSKSSPPAADPSSRPRPHRHARPICRCGRCCPSPARVRARVRARPGPSLAVSANVLRVIGPDGVRTRDIPALAGISREAVAMAVGMLAEARPGGRGPRPRRQPVQGHPPHRRGRRRPRRVPRAGGRRRGRLARPLRRGPHRSSPRRARAVGRRATRPRCSPASSPTRTTGAPGSKRRLSSRITR